MKNTVILNRYPADYVEEELPEVPVEIRYAGTKTNQKEVCELANKIKKFLFKLSGTTIIHYQVKETS